MTIKRLIERLSRYDENLIVKFRASVDVPHERYFRTVDMSDSSLYFIMNDEKKELIIDLFEKPKPPRKKRESLCNTCRKRCSDSHIGITTICKLYEQNEEEDGG